MVSKSLATNSNTFEDFKNLGLNKIFQGYSKYSSSPVIKSCWPLKFSKFLHERGKSFEIVFMNRPPIRVYLSFAKIRNNLVERRLSENFLQFSS